MNEYYDAIILSIYVLDFISRYRFILDGRFVDYDASTGNH